MNSSEMFQVLTVLRTNLSMRRDVALTGIFAKLCTMELAACGSQDNFHAFFPQGAARMHTGPEVAGCRSSSNWLNSLFYIYMFKFFLSYNLSALGMFQALHCIAGLSLSPSPTSRIEKRWEMSQSCPKVVLRRKKSICAIKNIQQVLRKAAMLKGSSVYVTEDLSRWMLDLVFVQIHK